MNTGRAATAQAMTPMTSGGGFNIQGQKIQANPISYLVCGEGAYGLEAGQPVIDNNNDPMPPSSADDHINKELYRTPFSAIDFLSPLSVKFTARIPKQYPEDLYPESRNPELYNPDGTPKDLEGWINEYALMLADGVTIFAKVNKRSTPKDGDLILVVQWTINF